MENTKNCPQCGNKMFHNIGISHKINPRTKKEFGPYENWKCGDKECGNIIWVDFKGGEEAPKEPTWSPKILDAEMLERIDRNVQYMTDKVKEKYGDK